MSSMDMNEMTVDVKNLYREESYTDMKVAQIRCLRPIKLDGSDDKTREPMFMGQSHIMSPQGPVPINAPLEGKTLEEAIANFPAAISDAVAEMIEEVKEYQRREASKIVTPGALGGGSKIIT